ncbi:MAG: cytochrome c [Vicinamibacterales bacterium]|nr:cytochrome c [Vicinamibacterales bacterium]
MRRVTLAICLAATLAGAGCRQDMHDQPKYKAQAQSDFFADKRAGRPLVAGTVARGFLRADTMTYTGRVNGQLTGVFPFPVTQAVMERGRERYDIFCAPCHSRTGWGDGVVVRRGYRRPTSFHDDRLRAMPVGHFYSVITNGFGAMPDYAQQVSPEDRWAIVAYIRALQRSHQGTLADVPAAERERLESETAR